MAGDGTRYNDEQIVRTLKDVDNGTTVAEASRQHGVPEQKVYRWRSTYAGTATSELQRPRELAGDNVRMEKIVAQQALDIDTLKQLAAKNGEPLRSGASGQTRDDRTEPVTTARLSAGRSGACQCALPTLATA